jgi:hypothetical protein
MPYIHKTVGTKVLETELEFSFDSDAELLDTEVRIPEPTTLCWISKNDIEKFTSELQALITKYAI